MGETEMSLIANLIFGLFYIAVVTNSVTSAVPFQPEKVYNFKTLEPYKEIQDIGDAYKFIPLELRNKLDSFGVKIIYHKSFFETPCPSPFSGTYRPWDHQIDVYCKRELSVLMAEVAHALDQLNGNGEFLSSIDPDFTNEYALYRNKLNVYMGTTDFRAWFSKRYPKGTWSYLPGKEDSSPILGPQGYQDIVELFMEGFIYYHYNPAKLARYYPGIGLFVQKSLDFRPTRASYPVFSARDIVIDYL